MKTPSFLMADEQGSARHGTSRRSLLQLLAAGGTALATPGLWSTLAAAQAPVPGGTLTIGADADPIGLDPVTVNAFSSYDFTSLLYTGLLRWNAQMKVEPDLAASYEQPDPKTYVFKLRQGVKFHNGKDFSAADVKHTFDRIMNPATGSRLKALYSSVESVTVVDPFTVKFQLNATDAAFLSNLATNPSRQNAPATISVPSSEP